MFKNHFDYSIQFRPVLTLKNSENFCDLDYYLAFFIDYELF